MKLTKSLKQRNGIKNMIHLQNIKVGGAEVSWKVWPEKNHELKEDLWKEFLSTDPSAS